MIFGVILQPIVTCIFTVGSFNLLLYERTNFKRKIDVIIYIYLLIMSILFLVNRNIFNFMYFILFIGLNFYPALIMIFYRKYFNSILCKIRKECFIFSFFLIFLLLISMLNSIVDIGLSYPNMGWYIVTVTICVITYLRLIQEVLLVKSKNILGKINIFSSVFVIIFVFSWVFILYQDINKINFIILALGLTEIFIFIIIFYLRICLEYKLHRRDDKIENHMLLSMLKIEEQNKEEFAEYLHDDILQNIIALKNITQVSCIDDENKKLIIDELNNMVCNIRNEVDTQKPIINMDDDLKTVYDELINELCKKYKTNRIVNFYCSHNLIIYLPYSTIIYRIIKELVNNGIKYSQGDKIDIYLDVRFDNIYIKANNINYNDKIKIGNGLNNIQKKVKFLKGKLIFIIKIIFIILIL